MALYTELPKYCKEMTRQELLEFFPEGTDVKVYDRGPKEGQEYEVPKYTNAFMMRSLIMNELEYCNTRESRTLRGVWYSAIKPTLDKLGLLQEEDQTEESLRRWDATLSNYVCDLLRRGKLTFSDLGIQDISRKKSNPSESYYNVTGRSYSYKGGVAPYPNILIATEKDTVYQYISTIAQLYGTSCISCKGQNSLGAMESIVKGMFRSGWKQPQRPKFDTIFILTMTDYDPAGYYIAEALEKQVNDILFAINEDHVNVEIHRIGITPDQLSEEEVRQNMYSPKKANIQKWMDRTGGIEGEEKGLELDAFSSSQIREIFVENLKPFIDVDLYKTFIKESYIKMKVLEACEDRINDVVKMVTDEVLEDVEMKDFDIHEFGINGDSYLDIEELCEDNQDDRINDLVTNEI